MIGFAFGAQPLLGYNYGAHNTKRLKEIIKFDLFVEITFAVITSIILALFTSSFIKIFMNDPSIIQAGTLMLRFLLLSSGTGRLQLPSISLYRFCLDLHGTTYHKVKVPHHC